MKRVVWMLWLCAAGALPAEPPPEPAARYRTGPPAAWIDAVDFKIPETVDRDAASNGIHQL